MLERRVGHFSNQALSDLTSLLADDFPSREGLIEQLVALSMLSPRELVRLLDMVFSRHAELVFEADDIFPLRPETVDVALDEYCKDAVGRIFDADLVRQVGRLPTVKFTNKVVQATFRIGAPAARNRIRGWVDAGAVAQTGERPAEGGTGGKPAHEYSIVDRRMQRVVMRQLLALDFDEWEEDEE